MKSGSIFRILNARNGWVDPNHQHLPQDQIASDGRQCCAFGGIRRVYYELLKSDETVNAHLYHQQLIKLHRALWKKAALSERHDKLIFLHDNACIAHVNNVQTTWRHSTGKCYPIPLTHLAPSDYHLFSSMRHALAERHFDSYEDIRKWLEWFASKDEEFFWRDIHKLPKRWEKCIVSEGKYFD